MTDQERAVNQQLHLYGEAYRMGHMSREEYRARRRHVLSMLCNSDSATTPSLLASQASLSRDTNSRASRSLPETTAVPVLKSGTFAWKHGLLFAGVIAVLAAVAFWFMRAPEAEAPAAIAPVVNGGGAVTALDALATRFVDDNRWEPSDINAFLQTWQRADISVRRRALNGTAVQRLRQQIASNLKVTSLLIDDSTQGISRTEQEQALQRFDHELASSQ